MHTKQTEDSLPPWKITFKLQSRLTKEAPGPNFPQSLPPALALPYNFFFLFPSPFLLSHPSPSPFLPSFFPFPPSPFLLSPSSFQLPPSPFLLPISSFSLPSSRFLLLPSFFPLPSSRFLLTLLSPPLLPASSFPPL